MPNSNLNNPLAKGVNPMGQDIVLHNGIADVEKTGCCILPVMRDVIWTLVGLIATSVLVVLHFSTIHLIRVK